MQSDRILVGALAHCVMGGLGWEATGMTEPPGPHEGEGEGPPGKGALRQMTAYPLQRLPLPGCKRRAQASSKHSTCIVI